MRKRRKKVSRMPAAVAEKGTLEELRSQARMLRLSISKKMTDAGITYEDVQNAVKKAKADVRRSRRSNGN